MKTPARMPEVMAVTEGTAKGLNQDADTWIAVGGGLVYTLTSAATASRISITTSRHSSQRCTAAENEMPT